MKSYLDFIIYVKSLGFYNIKMGKSSKYDKISYEARVRLIQLIS